MKSWKSSIESLLSEVWRRCWLNMHKLRCRLTWHVSRITTNSNRRRAIGAGQWRHAWGGVHLTINTIKPCNNSDGVCSMKRMWFGPHRATPWYVAQHIYNILNILSEK
jgi:hypothetical protein